MSVPDAYRTVVSKRDSREFTADPIPEEVVRRILQAGRMAGSSRNSQPCRFILIRDRAQKDALAACCNSAMWAIEAPLVVAIAVQDGASDYDEGRAAQNMMVAAWAHGVASCPFTMHNAECARRVLGLPEGWRPGHGIAFGYPKSEESRHRGQPRLPLEELVHHERW